MISKTGKLALPLLLITVGGLSCEKSNDIYNPSGQLVELGARPMRLSIYGVLTPGQEYQEVMVGNIQSLMVRNFLDFNFFLTEDDSLYLAGRETLVIPDPILGSRIWSSGFRGAPQDTSTLNRNLQMFKAGEPEILPGGEYGFVMERRTREDEWRHLTVTGSTVVPGDFSILSPQPGQTLKASDYLEVSWTPSPGAAGYLVFASTPQNLKKVFAAPARETRLTIPLFFVESARYHVEVWAADQNYFRFYLNQMFNIQVEPKLEIENPQQIWFVGETYRILLVGCFGSRVISSVDFIIE